jgi:hypothetical protein
MFSTGSQTRWGVFPALALPKSNADDAFGSQGDSSKRYIWLKR